MKFKLLAGSHQDHNNRNFKKGDVIDTSLDLAAMFGKSKFERLHSEREYEKKAAAEPETPEDARGEEVTEAFPTAVEYGFKVFKRGAWHYTYDGDKVETLNDKGLRKNAVEDFLQTQLSDADDDDDDSAQED